MDRIRQVQIFVQVIESGSFTKTAEIMSIPRSTISTMIQSLEDRLGVRLLQRTTRQVRPTDEGLRYLAMARQLLGVFDASEEMFEQVMKQAKGKLHVDMPSRIARRLVIPMLGEFLAQHPQIELLLSMTDRMVSLDSEGVDCVLRVGKLVDSNLICHSLGKITLINCASPDYLAEYGTPTQLEDLKQHLIVGYGAAFSLAQTSWEYVIHKEVRYIPMSSKITVDNAESYIACAIAGLGIIQVPQFDVQHLLDEGLLVKIMDTFRPSTMDISFLYPSRHHVPLRVRVFQAWISDLIMKKVVCI